MEDQTQVFDNRRVLFLSVSSLVVIVVAVISIIAFARHRIQRTQQIPPRDTASKTVPRASEISGRIGLSHKEVDAHYIKGQRATLFLYADSKEHKITGYDAVLHYDKTRLKFESVQSVLDGMDIYETERDAESAAGTTELIVTGIQGLGRAEPFMFRNTALAEITFVVLNDGPIDVELVYEPGSSRESNLITSNNQDILSTVVGTTIDAR